MKTTVHIISHSHWDREWYMAFEKHRMKLVELLDTASDLLENNENYRSFHMDGHTAAYDDYLEIKPEQKERIKKLVQEGKLTAGPWYVLQDEFLTSGEACVRNLLTGRKEALKLGKLCPIGYFPDAFGNAGQMPQVLAQAGMEAVAFGRGVKSIGFNNETLEKGTYETAYSEINWQSPDGSTLLGILFPNWYNNGMEIPVEPEEAKKFWDKKLADVKQYAGTSQLLFMNGCDHQPVQKDLPQAIETAKKLYPEIEFIHSDFETYVKAVKEELGENISVVKGELTSQETDGRFTLVNTASNRIDLKQLNRKGETALERKAEPAAVLAGLEGKKYPKELLEYSWKVLMQNHPHDSICSCNVDEVNDEVAIRFVKSRQVAEQLCKESMEYLTEQIDTSNLNSENGKVLPFAVYNFTGWNKTDVVSAVLDVDRCFENIQEKAYWEMQNIKLPVFVLKDAEGNTVDAKIEDMGTAFDYLLPDDKFRQPYMARQVRVTFEAKDVPAMGYRVYHLQEAEAKQADDTKTLITGSNTMENENIRVEIHEDGSYTLTNLKTGRVYSHIGYYEETGDIGNEYIYVQDTNGQAITTQNKPAKITLAEDTPFCAKYHICQSIEVPESAAKELEIAQKSFQECYNRHIGRSDKMVELAIETELTLEKSSKSLKIQTTIHNTAKDHRVRVVIPTGLAADTHFADSAFEVVERNNRHSKQWENPSGCDRQQSFVAMQDEKDGMLIANHGLYEYEVLPDMENAIAVTLLRCVGELGDWGYFPTPKAQMQGTYTLSYEILPFADGERLDVYTLGYQFQNELMAVPTGIHTGVNPQEKGFFNWTGEGVNFSGLKQQENGSDIMVRFINVTELPREIEIQKQSWMEKMYKSNVIEEEKEGLEVREDGMYHVVLKPFEILTLGIR